MKNLSLMAWRALAVSIMAVIGVAGLGVAAKPAAAALYVTGPNGASAQLTANFQGGNSCVRDTSNTSYVTLRAYNSSNQVMWTIQDNTNNGVSVCNYTVGGVHHLIAFLNSSPFYVPAFTKTWRANAPSSTWYYNGCNISPC